jgi:phosphoribosyl-AMP cyclohydrolase
MDEVKHLIPHLIERLRREHPAAVAILCHGSYARGAAEAHSDLDLDLLLDGAEDGFYGSLFEELADGRLLHITIGTQSLANWLAQFDEAEEGQDWAFFLPARQVARLLWATPEAKAQLEGYLTLEWQASPQLQDMLEAAAKVRNAHARNDDLGVRFAAQQLAVRCPALVVLFNSLQPVDTPRDALQAALGFAVVPPNYRSDLLLCMGLSGEATSAQQVYDAAIRLAGGILTMLRAHPEHMTDAIEQGLPAAVIDGRAMRLLTQTPS